MPHSLNLILRMMPSAQEPLLVAPCRMRLGGRILWFFIQNLKQKSQRLLAVLWRIRICAGQGAGIKVIGIKAIWAFAPCPLNLGSAKARLDSSDHAFSDLVLEIKDALHAAIKL